LPVILGDHHIPSIVLEIATAKKAKIYQYGIDYGLPAELNDLNSKIKNVNIRQNNIATSLKALEIILSLPQYSSKTYLPEIINQTVKDFNLAGRCSWLDKDKTILVDVAHNVQSISNLKNYLLNNLDTKNKQIVAVFGMLADKDIAQCLAVIYPLISHWYLASINEPRGVKAEEIAGILLTISNGDPLQYNCYDNIINCYETAYNFIKQNTNKNSILVVFGSFHIVGPVCENFK
jgi:dihydrofolate synthase/folylpolyglutamate synthase